ncbi:DUF4249 domain-containing protein [Psychroserpens sp. SPM9]|uniref:DUF4249 domain-containing protein n=1 Tax=Psychroserpens sp. SPM9 TaxID=2975598 RepID=UPI0021A2FC79|nr:DUF4249 domain-containing protein [Psychroserpens sp. SPM9]MDG5491082.1 DUF4249 domain-containing protein [Psychroserpens sp. SPM9]
MKTYIKYILSMLAVVFMSCEDVIDVDVPTGQTRLVIEASLDWEKGTSGSNQQVKLSTSTPYFETEAIPVVVGASVKVVNTNTNEEFVFVDQNDGTYLTTTFVPVIGNTYQLEVIYNDETYTATQTMTSVSDINNITQSIEGGFDDELLELNIYFDDPEDEANYYLVRYYEDGDLFPYFEDISDEFLNGNEIHDFFEKDDDEDSGQAPFQPGDTVEINLYGISESYYNYIRLLIEQYYSGGDPFSSTSAEIRGNCINETNDDNYAYGYFRATEVVKTSYTFQ